MQYPGDDFECLKNRLESAIAAISTVYKKFLEIVQFFG